MRKWTLINLGYNINMDVKKHNENLVNYMKSMQKMMAGFSKVKATVGVHSDKGEMNVKKAIWNEFGTKHISKGYKFIKNGVEYKIKRGTDIGIPARPFIRLYLYPQDIYKIEKELLRNLETTLNFHKRLGNNPLKSATSIVDNLGKVGAEIQREKIKNLNSFKSNAPLTQEIKGFDHPLYDTGELLASIDSKIERR